MLLIFHSQFFQVLRMLRARRRGVRKGAVRKGPEGGLVQFHPGNAKGLYQVVGQEDRW